MSICPKDFQPCVDDMCHGAGCMQMNGEPMIERCHICKEFYDEYSPCSCFDEEDDHEEYDESDDDSYVNIHGNF